MHHDKEWHSGVEKRLVHLERHWDLINDGQHPALAWIRLRFEDLGNALSKDQRANKARFASISSSSIDETKDRLVQETARLRAEIGELKARLEEVADHARIVSFECRQAREVEKSKSLRTRISDALFDASNWLGGKD